MFGIELFIKKMFHFHSKDDLIRYVEEIENESHYPREKNDIAFAYLPVTNTPRYHN